ncbi:MAG: RNA 2',3'-cyclic phosphodiesterase [Christensenellales bacterium]|jgi:2'-5' RNA ligase
MRVFFAIPLPEEARKGAEAMAFLAKNTLPGKYVRCEDYHITVRYVGEIAPNRLESLKHIGARCAANAAPHRLTLSGSGIFKGSILWAGVENGECYRSLSEEIRQALSEEGFPFDPKPYRAHVTVARDIRPDELPLPEPEPISWMPPCLVLYESARTGGVLRYLPIAQFPFGR